MTAGAVGPEPQQLGISVVPAGECWIKTSLIYKQKKNYLLEFYKIHLMTIQILFSDKIK